MDLAFNEHASYLECFLYQGFSLNISQWFLVMWSLIESYTASCSYESSLSRWGAVLSRCWHVLYRNIPLHSSFNSDFPSFGVQLHAFSVALLPSFLPRIKDRELILSTLPFANPSSPLDCNAVSILSKLHFEFAFPVPQCWPWDHFWEVVIDCSSSVGISIQGNKSFFHGCYRLWNLICIHCTICLLNVLFRALEQASTVLSR